LGAKARRFTTLRHRGDDDSLTRKRTASMRSLPLLLFVLAGAIGACGSSNAPDPGPSTPAPSVCSTDARAQRFAPGLEGTSKTGPLDIRLATISPTPPVKGNNVWTLAIADGNGNPVDGLELDVAPYMPDHRHPSSITPTVTPSGSGKYDVTSLNLAMGGIWTITVSVPTDGGVEASTVFTFCVDD
jgi:hypothetical protein